MAETTGIQWTDHTFNPWRGCTKVSPGCAHCYAETLSARNPAVLGTWGPMGTRPVAAESYWRQPLAWNRKAEREGRRHRVFCASLADIFEVVPPTAAAQIAAARVRLWDLIRATRWLDWQILTKRPERIATYMPEGDWPNVWLGVSIESQAYVPRLDLLTEARGHVRCPVGFVSAEPIIGPIDFGCALEGVQWLIIGGESGAEAREMRLSWAVSIVGQCLYRGVACFVKQLGKRPVIDRPFSIPLALLDGKNGDPDHWPQELRVRQFPVAKE